MVESPLGIRVGEEHEPNRRKKAGMLHGEGLLMDVQHAIALVETAFEVAGVSVLIIGALVALVQFAAAFVRRQSATSRYQALRHGLARAILLGLEFLVAADIIRSVALAPTFESVGVLGLIVLVRTFLSWSLEVEITGRWPWQRDSRAAARPSEDTDEL
ncbi:MAG: DUF1622 domain-containing protein [Ktedonobacterales bacterium]